MESFFPGWLISIGHYVEKLIKHGCFKEGKTPQILAEFPGRLSLTRQFNKLCLWLLHSSCGRLWGRVGLLGWLSNVNEVWGRGSASSHLFYFLTAHFLLGLSFPLLLPSFIWNIFASDVVKKYLIKWLNFQGVKWHCPSIIWQYEALCLFHLLNYAFQQARNHSEFWVPIAQRGMQ